MIATAHPMTVAQTYDHGAPFAIPSATNTAAAEPHTTDAAATDRNVCAENAPALLTNAHTATADTRQQANDWHTSGENTRPYDAGNSRLTSANCHAKKKPNPTAAGIFISRSTSAPCAISRTSPSLALYNCAATDETRTSGPSDRPPPAVRSAPKHGSFSAAGPKTEASAPISLQGSTIVPTTPRPNRRPRPQGAPQP